MTRLLDLLRRGLSAAVFCAAFLLAAMEVLADDPAPAAQTGEATESDDAPASDEPASDEKPEDAPEPEPSKGEQLFAEAVAALQSNRQSPEALAKAIRTARGLFEQIGALPEEDADEELRARAAALYDQMALGLVMYGSDEERKTLLPQLVEKAVGAETLGRQQYSLMATLLEKTAELAPDQTEATMVKFREAIEAKGGEDKEQALAQLEGVLRRATIVGSKLELAGTTFEGKDFDIGQLKGKVVLVDFWATWCPPCRAEHPNMLTNYRKYKDKGFEIVGVSLDDDREALKVFLDESEGHWIILHDEGGENPATEYYAIQGIPTMFLLDEQGVVISNAARGAELTRLLEERFGKVELPAEEEGEKEKSSEEKQDEEEKAETKEESEES